MHEKVKELIDYTAEKFKLTDFYLKRHQIFSEEDQRNNRIYILNMEWFPNNAAEQEDGLNPPGAVSMDLDFHTKSLKNIIFVNEINMLEADLPEANDLENTIEWVEQETGLEFGRQFKLSHSDSTKLQFHAAADNIPVFPNGSIELKFNSDEKLILFSAHGVFPEEEKISWEPFDLTNEDTEEIVKNQCTIFEIPVVDKERWQQVYSIGSSFITNKGHKVLSYEDVEADSSFTRIEKVLEWNTVAEQDFITKEIDLSTESTLEAALSNEQPTANGPIKEDKEKIIAVVKDFLQSSYPDDSGKWKVISARRNKGYLFVELKLAAGDTRVIQRKITVVLDGESLQPINSIDNSTLLETFKAFKKAPEAKISQEEAYNLLSQYVEVTPVYVYDKLQDTYILCGKIDCDYAVNAETGQLLSFDELN